MSELPKNINALKEQIESNYTKKVMEVGFSAALSVTDDQSLVIKDNDETRRWLDSIQKGGQIEWSYCRNKIKLEIKWQEQWVDFYIEGMSRQQVKYLLLAFNYRV